MEFDCQILAWTSGWKYWSERGRQGEQPVGELGLQSKYVSGRAPKDSDRAF